MQPEPNSDWNATVPGRHQTKKKACNAPAFTARPKSNAASGGREMKDQGSGDAGRDGNDSAPQPIRKYAKGKYRYASRQSDLDGDRSHRLSAP